MTLGSLALGERATIALFFARNTISASWLCPVGGVQITDCTSGAKSLCGEEREDNLGVPLKASNPDYNNHSKVLKKMNGTACNGVY